MQSPPQQQKARIKTIGVWPNHQRSSWNKNKYQESNVKTFQSLCDFVKLFSLCLTVFDFVKLFLTLLNFIWLSLTLFNLFSYAQILCLLSYKSNLFLNLPEFRQQLIGTIIRVIVWHYCAFCIVWHQILIKALDYKTNLIF